ncbi:MAG TPA: DUF4416 family protein, partial [Thermodesulfobacteriota bacterium]|nr:DUF4416 family protein [Thermodesulfobacteriota bacterium]
MSVPKIPEPAKLVISALTVREDLLEPVSKLLVEDLGPIEEEIGPIPFNYTKYYDREMGPGICRSLWSFARLV